MEAPSLDSIAYTSKVSAGERARSVEHLTISQLHATRNTMVRCYTYRWQQPLILLVSAFPAELAIVVDSECPDLEPKIREADKMLPLLFPPFLESAIVVFDRS